MAPADKTANKVVVVRRLYYFHILKQELSSTKAYEETAENKKSVIFWHSNDVARKFLKMVREKEIVKKKFSVNVKEQQDKLHTMF